MRLIERTLAASAAAFILATAGTAGAAWHFAENGPHPQARIAKQEAKGGATSSVAPSSTTYAPVCSNRRRSTVKPFLRYCVRSTAKASR